MSVATKFSNSLLVHLSWVFIYPITTKANRIDEMKDTDEMAQIIMGLRNNVCTGNRHNYY